jgi:hypothetical protein
MLLAFPFVPIVVDCFDFFADLLVVLVPRFHGTIVQTRIVETFRLTDASYNIRRTNNRRARVIDASANIKTR